MALFNLSYFGKYYLTGPNAEEAADWLFTANTDKDHETIVYTCALNEKGGVEADMTVMPLKEGVGRLVGPILKVRGHKILCNEYLMNFSNMVGKRILHCCWRCFGISDIIAYETTNS